MKKTGLLLAALSALILMGCGGGYYDQADYRVGNYHGHAPGNTYYSDQERWARDHDQRDYRDYRNGRDGRPRYDDRY